MIRLLRCVAASAALLVLGACSTFTFFDSAPKNPPTPLVDFNPTLAVQTVWTHSVGESGKYFFSPAFTGEALYAAAADGTLERIDPASGASVWRIRADKALTAGVGASRDSVAVVNSLGELMVFDTAGQLRWKAVTGGEVLSAPGFGDGLVIVRTTDGRFLAYDETSGKRKWLYSRPAQPLVLRGAPGLAFSAGGVFAGVPGGRLIALATSNGAVIWDSPVAIPKGATELERVADVMGQPVISGREICVAAFQGRAACFDGPTGNAIWFHDVSTSSGVGVDARFVFVSDETSSVIALSRSGGTSVWRNDKLRYRSTGTPASIDRAVVVDDFEGILSWMSREDGSFVARTPTDGSPSRVAPQVILVGGRSALLVQTQKGNLFLFAPK